jgi:hypothetical protein
VVVVAEVVAMQVAEAVVVEAVRTSNRTIAE